MSHGRLVIVVGREADICTTSKVKVEFSS